MWTSCLLRRSAANLPYKRPFAHYRLNLTYKKWKKKSEALPYEFGAPQHINSLLFRKDAGAIISALQLLLCPSQQHSSQPSASGAVNVSNKCLISLACQLPPVDCP